MKDLTEAYKEVYQLDEVSFANVGSLASNVMRMPGVTPPKKEEPSKDKPAATPAAATTPAPSAMDQWAKAHPKLAAAAAERARIRGTSETDNPLMKDMRANLPAPTKAQDPNFQSIMKSGKTGDQGYQSLTQNPNVRATAPATSTAQSGTAAIPTALQAVSQAAQASINKDPRAQAFDTTKYGFSGQSKTTPNNRRNPLLRTNSYDYGQIDSQQLTSLLNSYHEMYETEEELDEKCWDGYTQKGMKKKGDKMVPNCVKTEEVEAYDIILDHIFSEGLATTVESAEKIMSVMSDSWMQGILEDWSAGVKLPFGSSSGVRGPTGVYGSYSTSPTQTGGTQAAVKSSLMYGDTVKGRTPETAVDQALTNLNTGAPIPAPEVKTGLTGSLDAKVSGSLGSGQQQQKPESKPERPKRDDIRPTPKPEDPRPTVTNAPIPPPDVSRFVAPAPTALQQVDAMRRAAAGVGDRQSGMGVLAPPMSRPTMPGF